ncbi:WRKY DNA-binding transcription factor 70 [Rhododendron vialii]|uniref:WRKY DNA-binding transcription factor 70 n=1 Tax=Rhododendron vialii TaxID=182163 RepID=UPI00265F85EF|nr:WRKY DNA-binding transcription factor 70 [Rhododendron vialii]
MGTLSLPEKICANRKRALEELIKGRDTAAQLQILFGKSVGDRGPVSAEGLVVEISRSFSDSISVLMSSCDQDCEACKVPAATQVGSPSCGDGRSVDSGESSKRPAAKEKRGCYKRRKSTSESCVKVSTTSEDDHAWRKYGQKEILNAQFPRCYFRCTHKHDQGCLATKQVQRIQDAPHMYQTTYFGHHTCRPYPLNNHPDDLQNPSSDSDPVDSYLLSFGSKTITTDEKEHQHQYPSCRPSSVKKEYCGEETVQSNNLSGDLPAVEPIVWPELMPLESSSVYSSASTSSHGYDMDLLLESGDFGSGFHFDEASFL